MCIDGFFVNNYTYYYSRNNGKKMVITGIVFAFIILFNIVFLFQFCRDFVRNWKELTRETSRVFLLVISTPLIFFFSALGISDFAVSTLFYRKMRLVSDKLLPGTLNTQCVIPVAVMAIAFISVIQVDSLTLFVCILSQMTGAYFGPQFVSRLSPQLIRLFIGSGLLLATVFILANKLDFIPTGGTAYALTDIKLVIAAICLAIYGGLNTLGIGSYAPTMVTMYALGMNPVIAFPIMMGASAFSVPIASMQFIKHGQYSRKITLIAATWGTVGALVGVNVVHMLDVSMLQWVLAGVLFYSGSSLLINELKMRWNPTRDPVIQN